MEDKHIDEIRNLFLKVYHKFSCQTQILKKSYGITIHQANIILLLNNKECISMTELSERVYLNKSTVSGIVFRMFKKGWINVERVESDRRRLKITLTEEGKNLAQWLEASQVWNIFTPIGKLPAERIEYLLIALKELVGHLDWSQPSSEDVFLTIDEHIHSFFEKNMKE
ncbi:MAG TPA: MarR family transcriptional regulator [Candidatus Eremiobacteraeota bacterium]|nr:MAG: HTH-type transcriptional regulator SarZ [bacterium ADurb.Bin363]HPZ10495.1 MarR family transcriptional regulator [Candidatus Eremiobacteraeota bacterium]